jgi:hypothetical protein
VDIAFQPTDARREKHWLKKVQDLIDWTTFRRKFNRLCAENEGRLAWPPDALFRCLLLAEWNNLSDTQWRDALGFRIDYRRFAGLDLDVGVPDATTFVACRKRIQPIRHKLLEIPNRQLEAKGYKVHEAVAVDASLVEAQSKPHREGMRINRTAAIRMPAGGAFRRRKPQLMKEKKWQAGARRCMGTSCMPRRAWLPGLSARSR